MAKTLLIFLFTSSVFGINLKVGDILLQPLHCRLCNLIEGETNSEYSHIGVVLQTNPEIFIGEAFQKVRRVTLKDFMSKTQRGLKIRALRPRGDFRLIKKVFIRKFEGKPYDPKFLWDNATQYCSEFTWKLLRHFTRRLPRPRPMTFEFEREQWYRYFKGKIPDGKIGISPAHFERFKSFRDLGEIE